MGNKEMYDRFYDFGLSDQTLKAVTDMGFEEPSFIQRIAIPHALKGVDIVGVAQTGTGKTAAFGIPIVEKGARGKSKRPSTIVLVPTRELAVQVAQELNRIAKYAGMVAVPIYGGQSIERQIKSLLKGVDIVVGTPGRVIDHIQRKTLVLSEVVTVVLDEADEMLNMGFLDDMEKILKEIPKERQTMLFSATMPDQILNISKKYMSSPKKVSVDPNEIVASKIKQIFYEVRYDDKVKALTRIIDVQDDSLMLIFCHTKKDVDELSRKLQEMGYNAGAIHGDYTQSLRDEMMYKFKRGEIDILVATDVAARGLDINDVTHVVNYSIPQNPDSYVHRIGRTGRAGKTGIAITFVTPREYSQLKLIERSAKTKISKGKLPSRDEVLEAREKELRRELESVIEDGKQKDFYPFVNSLFEAMSPVDVAAAAISLMAGDMLVEHIEEPGARSGGSEGGGQSRQGFKSGMTRLFLTIGKMDKISVNDIVKAISEKAGIPGNKIGDIALFDKFSFVEVPRDMAERVIVAINDMTVKGRRVKAQAANKRKTA